MKVLVLGATGLTGRLVVKLLLDRDIQVRALQRTNRSFFETTKNYKLLEVVTGNICEFDISENSELIKGCDAIVCCLGHNLTLKGLFGKPRMLVSDSIKNICSAIEHSRKDKVKLVLMNTTAHINKPIDENYSFFDRAILSLLYYFLPPHKDNVEAATYLTNVIGESNLSIEWIAVRPDSLINQENVSKYEILDSIKRSPIFDAGVTGRINVAHFIVELLVDEKLWNKRKFQMPVIYNCDKSI